jgi:hypothetical protein
MIRSWKFVFIATAVTLGIASQAFAQSYDPDDGTGNLVLSDQVAVAPINHSTSGDGLYAFAMASRGRATMIRNYFSPSLTGGGILGYKQAR